MYESKFSKYISKNEARFAFEEEILENLTLADKQNPAAGAPLYFDENGKLYVDNCDNHTLICGPTGCKKTRTVIYQTVESIIAAGESAIINDPKGEIYAMTANAARKKGAGVYVLNFRNPQHSNGWNPLTLAHRFMDAGDEDAAFAAVQDFAERVLADQTLYTNDRYWPDTARAYLTSILLLLLHSVPPEYDNMITARVLAGQKCSEEMKYVLDRMKQDNVCAYGLHTVLDVGAEKTRSCIFGMLSASIGRFFFNDSLEKLICTDDIDVTKISDEQTIIYIIYPDEKMSFSFIVNAFLSQCYEALISIANKQPNGMLPIRTNFVIDEFANLPAIENFDNRISEARGRNIRYFLCMQTGNQLKTKYREYSDTIFTNCTNWMLFASKDIELHAKIEKICGNEIDFHGNLHPLISSHDMQHLQKSDDSAEVLVLTTGKYPYVCALPDVDKADIYGRQKKAQVSDVNKKYSNKIKSLTFSQWRRGIISGKYNFPYKA